MKHFLFTSWTFSTKSFISANQTFHTGCIYYFTLFFIVYVLIFQIRSWLACSPSPQKMCHLPGIRVEWVPGNYTGLPCGITERRGSWKGGRGQEGARMGGALYSLVRLACNTLYPAYASFKVIEHLQGEISFLVRHFSSLWKTWWQFPGRG